jgi:phenylpropionate dioxygenase-like ring-hydroxylating dioxygenase large terminal subunit
MIDLFASRDVVTQSWYIAARSGSIAPGRIRLFELGSRRIAVYRDEDGHAHAVDARCPHLGADLTLGDVCGDGIRCAFHGWTFGHDGACTQAPGHTQPPDRRARTYPLVERWGFIWIFNGPAPRFDLPAPEVENEWRAFALPAQTIRCHPHLVLANGLDLTHYETLHGLEFTQPSRLLVSRPHEVTVEMRGRPQSRFWRAVSGTRHGDLVARFTTYGGSLAWSSVLAPTRFHVLFTGRPDRQGQCVTQTIFLVPRAPGTAWLRAFGLMAMLLHDDRRVLDTIDFRPHFSDADEPLKAFAAVVNGLGSW